MRTFTGILLRAFACFSNLICSSIRSLTRRASTSLVSRKARCSGVSFAGGAKARASGPNDSSEPRRTSVTIDHDARSVVVRGDGVKHGCGPRSRRTQNNWRGGGLVKRAASRFRLRFMYRQPFGDDRDCITGAWSAGEPNSLSGRRSITASRNSVEKVAPRGLLARAHSVPGGARTHAICVTLSPLAFTHGLVLYHQPHLQETCTSHAYRRQQPSSTCN